MYAATLLHNIMRNRPLSIICLCGIAGVFVDIDHIPFALGLQYPVIIDMGVFWQGRNFHGFSLFLGLCIICACLGRLVLRIVLNKISKRKT